MKKKQLKTVVIDGIEYELTPKGNLFEMTIAKAEKMYEIHGRESFEMFQSWDFPYPVFNEKRALSELRNLKSKQNGDTTASHIIKTMHKSRYSCLRGNMLSPIAYWEHLKDESQYENENWRKFYINRLRNAATSSSDMFRKDGIMRADTICAGLTITHRADCPSYFKPHLAKRLVSTYLNRFDEVFCPFNGFSGIMLGAAVGCGKTFVGQDLNATEISESKNIVDFIKCSFDAEVDVNLKVKDLFDDSGKHECLIACPPYGNEKTGNIEKWNFDENGNSIDKNLACDAWIDECLDRYDCKKYVFIVDDRTTVKHKAGIVETLTNRCHFGSNYEYVVVIER